MATDTLEVFGTEYTNVAGFKATDDNGNTKTYIRPQGTLSISANGTGIDVSQYASADVAVSGGNEFVVTFQKNGVTGYFEPDKTVAEVYAAEQAGKTIGRAGSFPISIGNISQSGYEYSVMQGMEGVAGNYYYLEQAYSIDSSGNITLEDEFFDYDTSDADSAPSDVVLGKVFYTSTGREVGSATPSVPTIQSLTVTPTTSQQTFNASGVDGYKPVTVNAMPTGSATAPATISGTSATVSTGTNTLTLSKTVSVTPSVSAGYVSSGTAGDSSVSLQASVTTKAAATITPGTSNQTIASGTYLTGTQTISGDANLVAGNIKSGTSIFGVTGTYSGGGSDDVKTGTLTVASNVNTSASTQITTTTAIGFTPKVFIFYRSDRSATSNHVNQASFVTLGTTYYVRTMTRYSNNALSTSGNANNWTTQTAGYLYFNSNTIYFRSSSSYILPAGTWYWVAIK